MSSERLDGSGTGTVWVSWYKLFLEKKEKKKFKITLSSPNCVPNNCLSKTRTYTKWTRLKTSSLLYCVWQRCLSSQLQSCVDGGCFTPVLHTAKEGKDLVYVPQAPSNGSWFVTELAKLELNPGTSKNVCTQSETPEYIWRPQYNQFARLIVVSVGTSFWLSENTSHRQWRLTFPRL